MPESAAPAIYQSIFCCGCEQDVQARLTDGVEIYPHRPDLGILPFWRCDACGNSVGCHHKTPQRTKPLGCIPTPELKAIRQRIHAAMDPLWSSGRMSRSTVYSEISRAMGWKNYHTADLRSLDNARKVLDVVIALGASPVSQDLSHLFD